MNPKKVRKSVAAINVVYKELLPSTVKLLIGRAEYLKRIVYCIHETA